MNTGNRYSTERTGEPQTVLVVDDDPLVRSFEAELLSNQGYKVLQAENGTEALRLADTATIDLLLTDFIMPDVEASLTKSSFDPHSRCAQSGSFAADINPSPENFGSS